MPKPEVTLGPRPRPHLEQGRVGGAKAPGLDEAFPSNLQLQRQGPLPGVCHGPAWLSMTPVGYFSENVPKFIKYSI